MVALETKRREQGDADSCPLYHHQEEKDAPSGEGEDELVGGMTPTEIDLMYDSVRTKISNMSETRDRLINDYSNLTRSERSKRGNMSLASNLRRTPRMHPVGPHDAGKGLSATPRGRSSRIKKQGDTAGGVLRRKARK